MPGTQPGESGWYASGDRVAQFRRNGETWKQVYRWIPQQVWWEGVAKKRLAAQKDLLSINASNSPKIERKSSVQLEDLEDEPGPEVDEIVAVVATPAGLSRRRSITERLTSLRARGSFKSAAKKLQQKTHANQPNFADVAAQLAQGQERDESVQNRPRPGQAESISSLREKLKARTAPAGTGAEAQPPPVAMAAPGAPRRNSLVQGGPRDARTRRPSQRVSLTPLPQEGALRRASLMQQ